MKHLLTLFFIIISLSAFSQNKNFQIGLGTSSITSSVNTFSLVTTVIDAEFQFDINERFAIGLNSNTGYGFDLSTTQQNVIYQQGILNGYYKLLNNRMRVGLGLSLTNYWQQEFDRFRFISANHSPVYGNLVVEYKVWEKENQALSLKAFRQSNLKENLTGLSIRWKRSF